MYLSELFCKAEPIVQDAEEAAAILKLKEWVQIFKIKLEFYCQFSNPWVLGVSRIGCYVRKFENVKITAP